MMDYVLSHIIAAAVVVAASKSSGAQAFYWGDVARFVGPRLPAPPPTWQDWH